MDLLYRRICSLQILSITINFRDCTDITRKKNITDINIFIHLLLSWHKYISSLLNNKLYRCIITVRVILCNIIRYLY